MNIMDSKKAITAEDLIRRYNLDGLKSDRKIIQNIKQEANNTDTILNNFIEATLSDLKNLQDQVDGNIATWFFSGVPTLDNSPAVDWTTDKDKTNHLGDLYYDKDTGYAYRFTLEDNVYKWIKLSDSDIAEALAIANAAQDTADSKRRVFVAQPTPPYDVGDIWIKNDKDLYRCRVSRSAGEFNEVDWIRATDYSNDDYAKNVEAVLNQFKETVETDYTTHVQLETTKDSILASVESTTKQTETLINNNYQDLSGKIEECATVENVTEVKQEVENLHTSTEYAISVVEDIQKNGVSQVKTENNFTFNKEGLTINESNAPVKNQLDSYGMEIQDKTGATHKTQFFSGYVTQELVDANPVLAPYLNKTITFTDSIIFNQYLASNNGRLEDVEDETYGKGIGIFITGGDN